MQGQPSSRLGRAVVAITTVANVRRGHGSVGCVSTADLSLRSGRSPVPESMVRTVLFRPAAALFPDYALYTGRWIIAAKRAATVSGERDNGT